MTKQSVKSKQRTVNRKQIKQKAVSQKLQTKNSLVAQVINFAGKTTKISLPKEVFKVEVAPATLAQAVRVYLANQRKGTAKTLTRGEVSGGGRKPRPQKYTGRSRQGSIRAPHWRGGGIIFGPKPADFELKLPKKVKQKALFGAISQKFAKGEVRVVEGFEKVKPKTKELVKAMEKLNLSDKKNLWVVNGKPENLVRAGRNLPNLEFSSAKNLNTHQVLKAATLIFNKDAIEKLTLRYTQGHLFESEPIRFLESESRNRRPESHGRRPQTFVPKGPQSRGSRRPERSRRMKERVS